MPSNIVENFGNASGATIPTNISFNIGGRLKQEQIYVLSGRIRSRTDLGSTAYEK